MGVAGSANHGQLFGDNPQRNRRTNLKHRAVMRQPS